MIAKEMKRRTDKVHRDMSEVIVNGGPLSAVAKGVQDVNETLAHHAAWTEERFERVEERLGGLELGQQAILGAVGGLTIRVDKLEDKLDNRFDSLALRIDKVLAFAIKDEPKLAEILKEDNDKS